MEKWKPVKGYEGYYEVSSLGRVKSLGKTYQVTTKHKTRTQYSQPRITSQVYDRDGYLKVGLIRDKTNTQFKVHRLVAMAFLDNPQNKSQVNHKNGIKDDNRVENLEWATPKENVIHAHKTGLCGMNGMSKQVAQLDMETGEIIHVYESARQAMIAMGKNPRTSTNLTKVCRKGYGSCGGYGWKFITLEEYLKLK